MQIKLFSSMLLSAILLVTQTAYANLPSQPAKCPGTNAIKSVGIDIVERNNGTWAAGVRSNPYDTQDAWTFAVTDIAAQNAEEARLKATASLNTLQFKQGPIPVAQFNVWACFYQTAEGYKAISVTPPLNVRSSLKMVK